MDVRTIDPRTLAEIVKTRPVALIDVRSPLEYQQIHIPQATNIPLDELDPIAVARGHGDNPEPIYVVCRSGGRGRKACERFFAAGYENVVNVEGGTSAWAAAGLPVDRGRSYFTIERQGQILAGGLALLGVILAWLVDPAFMALSAFIGAGLIYVGLTESQPMTMILAKMPWNHMVTRGGCVVPPGPDQPTPQQPTP